jgi:hypothetical protein
VGAGWDDLQGHPTRNQRYLVSLALFRASRVVAASKLKGQACEEAIKSQSRRGAMDPLGRWRRYLAIVDGDGTSDIVVSTYPDFETFGGTTDMEYTSAVDIELAFRRAQGPSRGPGPRVDVVVKIATSDSRYLAGGSKGAYTTRFS